MGASLEWSARTRRGHSVPARGTACVIEPDEDVRVYVAAHLAEIGYTTHETPCGAVGMFIATQVRLDAIIVGLGLLDMRAPSLIKRLREIAPNAQLVALSPNARSSVPMTIAELAGADTVLASPPSADALAAVLAPEQPAT
jgi:DNA-binding response OmpR family regulator